MKSRVGLLPIVHVRTTGTCSIKKNLTTHSVPKNPGRFGPIPVRSGRFGPGRFGPISGVSRFGPVGEGRFGPISKVGRFGPIFGVSRFILIYI